MIKMRMGHEDVANAFARRQGRKQRRLMRGDRRAWINYRNPPRADDVGIGAILRHYRRVWSEHAANALW